MSDRGQKTGARVDEEDAGFNVTGFIRARIALRKSVRTYLHADKVSVSIGNPRNDAKMAAP